MVKFLLVGLGGFLGSILRFSLGEISQRLFPFAGFPIGTFLVNVTGCFLIGLLNGFADVHNLINPNLRLFLSVGFLGGFTTFSTFGLETLLLSREGNLPGALVNVGIHLFFGLLFVWMGYNFVRG